MKFQIKQASDSLKDLEMKESSLEEMIGLFGLQKQLRLNEILLHQKHQKRYRELETGKYVMMTSSESSRSAEYAKQIERLNSMSKVIDQITYDATPAQKQSLQYVKDFLETFQSELIK